MRPCGTGANWRRARKRRPISSTRFDPERPFADSPMNGRYAPHCGRTRNAADALGTFPLMADRVATATACNKRIRDLSGFEEPLPAVGDRLVCLRNDRTKGLVWRLVEGRGARLRAEGLRPHGRALGGRWGGEVGQVAVLNAFFEGTEGDLAYAIRREPTSSTTAMR
jgi:exodeoxyribonuclease V